MNVLVLLLQRKKGRKGKEKSCRDGAAPGTERVGGGDSVYVDCTAETAMEASPNRDGADINKQSDP